MLDTLKKLATTQSCDLAILSETERRSLAAMKAPWATQLTTVIRSALFPTPQVVRFGDQPNATAVQEALRRLTADPLAKPLLAEMRLAGFVVP
ncbi:MAG: hypothetical protein HYV03_05990 [Deltaproteobacteria bacterium]|nr:hypothetical protein [Deltaproteobacteria bacterium]